MTDAALRSDNSRIDGCDKDRIVYCKTDSGTNDHMCLFAGTNILSDRFDTPSCYYNCQMETCNAWTSPTTDLQKQCVETLLHSSSVSTSAPPTSRALTTTSESTLDYEGMTLMNFFEWWALLLVVVMLVDELYREPARDCEAHVDESPDLIEGPTVETDLCAFVETLA